MPWSRNFARSTGGDEETLRKCAAALVEGKVTDRALGKILGDWCAAPERRQSMLDAYLDGYSE